MIGIAAVPIAVVSDNGPCFQGEVFKIAFAGPDPLLRHVRTRVRSPQTNGVIERFFGTLKYEHFYQGGIADGDTLVMEVHRCSVIGHARYGLLIESQDGESGLWTTRTS